MKKLLLFVAVLCVSVPGVALAAQPQTSGPTLEQLLIREVQLRLHKHGKYHPGPPAGLYGTRLRSAIRDYQKDHGLPVSGVLTRQLIEHLRSHTTLSQQELR